MQEAPFLDAVNEICRRDPRFHPEAYFLVREALDFTVKMYRRAHHQGPRHVTGRELLDGIRQFTLKEYGPMSRTLLTEWGVTKTEDFGEIVFNLVECGKLGKTEQDRREDFAGGYDFEEAFVRPFEPPRRERQRKRSKPGTMEKRP